MAEWSKDGYIITPKGCDHCLDPDGQPCCPWVGVTPHRHKLTDIGDGHSMLHTIEDDSLFDETCMEMTKGGECIYYCPTEGCPNSKALYKWDSKQ